MGAVQKHPPYVTFFPEKILPDVGVWVGWSWPGSQTTPLLAPAPEVMMPAGGAFPKMGTSPRWHDERAPHLSQMLNPHDPFAPIPMGGEPTHLFTHGGFLPQLVCTPGSTNWHTPSAFLAHPAPKGPEAVASGVSALPPPIARPAPLLPKGSGAKYAAAISVRFCRPYVDASGA